MSTIYQNVLIQFVTKLHSVHNIIEALVSAKFYLK